MKILEINHGVKSVDRGCSLFKENKMQEFCNIKEVCFSGRKGHFKETC